MASPVVILVAGDPVANVAAEHGTFSALIRRAAGEAWQGSWLDVDLRTSAPLPPLPSLAPKAVIVTGSASSVADREPWVVRGEAYLRELVAARVPVFGICFGHQMLGQALGGSVAKNPRGREIGTVDLHVIAPDPVFGDVVPGAGGAGRARVNTTHVDTVERLPPGSKVLATTAREPHAAVRFTETAWGVQFHPEMTAAVARGYLKARRDVIAREGGDPDAMIRDADDGEAGRATLRRFLAVIQQR